MEPLIAAVAGQRQGDSAVGSLQKASGSCKGNNAAGLAEGLLASRHPALPCCWLNGCGCWCVFRFAPDAFEPEAGTSFPFVMELPICGRDHAGCVGIFTHAKLVKRLVFNKTGLNK